MHHDLGLQRSNCRQSTCYISSRTSTRVFFLEVYKRWIQKNVFYLMESWCCFVDVLLSFHPHQTGKVVEPVMQANDEVRREVSTWENLRTPPEKSLKLVLSIYIYIYIIFIYI